MIPNLPLSSIVPPGDDSHTDNFLEMLLKLETGYGNRLPDKARMGRGLLF